MQWPVTDYCPVQSANIFALYYLQLPGGRRKEEGDGGGGGGMVFLGLFLLSQKPPPLLLYLSSTASWPCMRPCNLSSISPLTLYLPLIIFQNTKRKTPSTTFLTSHLLLCSFSLSSVFPLTPPPLHTHTVILLPQQTS